MKLGDYYHHFILIFVCLTGNIFADEAKREALTVPSRGYLPPVDGGISGVSPQGILTGGVAPGGLIGSAAPGGIPTRGGFIGGATPGGFGTGSVIPSTSYGVPGFQPGLPQTLAGGLAPSGSFAPGLGQPGFTYRAVDGFQPVPVAAGAGIPSGLYRGTGSLLGTYAPSQSYGAPFGAPGQVPGSSNCVCGPEAALLQGGLVQGGIPGGSGQGSLIGGLGQGGTAGVLGQGGIAGFTPSSLLGSGGVPAGFGIGGGNLIGLPSVGGYPVSQGAVGGGIQGYSYRTPGVGQGPLGSSFLGPRFGIGGSGVPTPILLGSRGGGPTLGGLGGQLYGGSGGYVY